MDYQAEAESARNAAGITVAQRAALIQLGWLLGPPRIAGRHGVIAGSIQIARS